MQIETCSYCYGELFFANSIFARVADADASTATRARTGHGLRSFVRRPI